MSSDLWAQFDGPGRDPVVIVGTFQAYLFGRRLP